MEEKRSNQAEASETPSVDLVEETEDVPESEESDEVEAEIAELQQKLVELTARGEAVREMIVEQTRLLLGEEKVLTKVRRNKIRDQIKQNKKTTVGQSSESKLSAEQQVFLQDLT